MTVLDARARFTAAASSARVTRWALVTVGVCLAAGLVWLVWFSSVLSVREVRVVGAAHVSASAVTGAASVPLGTPLARVDAAAVSARVAALPRVAAVEVRRGWPNVLVVVVTERVPVATVPAPLVPPSLAGGQTGSDQASSTTGGGAGPSYVDVTGATFGPVTSGPRLPMIVSSNPAALTSAAAVVGSLPADLRSRVVSVVARTRDDVVFTLNSGQQVRWGDASSADRKAAVLAALLPTKAARYDVSAPDLPTSSGRL